MELRLIKPHEINKLPESIVNDWITTFNMESPDYKMTKKALSEPKIRSIFPGAEMAYVLVTNTENKEDEYAGSMRIIKITDDYRSQMLRLYDRSKYVDHRWLLEDVIVAVKFRRQGLCREMIEFVVKKYEGKLALEVDKNNYPGLICYMKNGFVFIDYTSTGYLMAYEED